MCLICCDDIDTDSKGWRRLTGCVHSFCTDCLGDYLAECAKSNTGVVVKCPHHECKSLLSPSELVELAPTAEVHDKLLAASNDNMVVSANDLRFCPYPGCGQKGAVKINTPEDARTPKLAGTGLLELVGAVCTNVQNELPDKGVSEDYVEERSTVQTVLTYEGVPDARYYDLTSFVQPKSAHRFCFQCGEQFIHWPVSCEQLSAWKTTIDEQINEVDGDAGAGSNFNDVAQKLWMKANTRPCPKVRHQDFVCYNLDDALLTHAQTFLELSVQGTYSKERGMQSHDVQQSPLQARVLLDLQK
jgi:hypothetical protein